MITEDEKKIIVHVLKDIADRERRHIEWVNGILDSMCHELNITIPERRNGDRRGT